MYKRIVLAYNGSEPGQRALLECRELAQWNQASLFLVAARPATVPVLAVDGAYIDQWRDEDFGRECANTLADGISRLSDLGHAASGEVVIGEPVEAIVGYARKVRADLIVVGHRHREGWASRWWRGSPSAWLSDHAPCSGVVVSVH